VALGERDSEGAALIREEFRLPGMGQTAMRFFRDKLAMRSRARQIGIRVPKFIPIWNDKDIGRWIGLVPPPWLLKPRFGSGAVGIRKIERAAHLWKALQELGERRSEYLLEEFISGSVYHVDAVTWDREVLFHCASAYGTPPLQIVYEGGIFTTKTLPRASELAQTLQMMDREVGVGLGMISGVSHSEYIQANNGELYFLEASARVGGGHITDLVEAAHSINLWVQWARIEACLIRNERYRLPAPTMDCHAGVVFCLTRHLDPNLSKYTDPEIMRRFEKRHHVGLIVANQSAARVSQLVDCYRVRFASDFMGIGQSPTR